MSWLSKFVDENLTHSTERKKAQERNDQQLSEYNNLKAETKAKADQLEKEKTYEENRVAKSKMRRIRGGSRKTGFLNEAGDDVNERLG